MITSKLLIAARSTRLKVGITTASCFFSAYVTRSMANELKFDNRNLRVLPVDEDPRNYRRTVAGTITSMVQCRRSHEFIVLKHMYETLSSSLKRGWPARLYELQCCQTSCSQKIVHRKYKTLRKFTIFKLFLQKFMTKKEKKDIIISIQYIIYI